MKKFKKIWQSILQKYVRLSLKKRRRLLIFSLFSFIIIAFLFYYSIALARISEAEINLAALKEEVNTQKICHEDCLSLRKKQELVVISAIKKSEKNILIRLKNYWFDPKESLEFKKEIINLWRLNNDLNIVPPYLYNYVDASTGDVKLQALIISSFLAPSKEKRWLDYYFNILSSSRDKSLKKEALRALSNREDKDKNFTLKQAVFLKNLVINLKTPLEIKPDIVLLLGEYYSIFPEQIKSILEEIYINKELDNITRVFAGDILNRENGDNKYILPEISAQEWQNYYNE